MASVIEWPRSLRRTASTFHPLTLSKSGGRTMTGAEQIVATDAGYWTGTVSVLLRSPADLQLWRATQALLQGRVNKVYVGPENQIRQPGGVALGYVLPSSAGTTFSDGARFSDSSSFSTPAASGTSSGAVASGATTATIVVSTGVTLDIGQFFEVGQRLYLINASTLTTTNTYTVGFWPPARAAFPSGSYIELDNPRGLFRLAADTEMPLDWGLGIPLTLKASFVEASA